MSIQLTCDCGKRLKAPDELAGKKAKCPSCGRAITVPAEVAAPEASPGDSPSYTWSVEGDTIIVEAGGRREIFDLNTVYGKTLAAAMAKAIKFAQKFADLGEEGYREILQRTLRAVSGS